MFTNPKLQNSEQKAAEFRINGCPKESSKFGCGTGLAP